MQSSRGTFIPIKDDRLSIKMSFMTQSEVISKSILLNSEHPIDVTLYGNDKKGGTFCLDNINVQEIK